MNLNKGRASKPIPKLLVYFVCLGMGGSRCADQSSRTTNHQRHKDCV